jgi:predicted nucleic acid-binding protein
VGHPSLIDTGAALALLDQSDPWNGTCSQALSECALPLITTAAVLTEVFHFLVGDRRRVANGWRFVRSGILTVMPITDDDAAELERLMLKYADRPMDFADATLVRVAERERLTTILTVDRDFEVYRIGGRKAFRVVPER